MFTNKKAKAKNCPVDLNRKLFVVILPQPTINLMVPNCRSDNKGGASLTTTIISILVSRGEGTL